MTVERLGEDGYVVTGEHIPIARLLALRGMLKLEILGLRRSRGRSAASIIKQEFGLKGSNNKVLVDFEALLRQNGILS